MGHSSFLFTLKILLLLRLFTYSSSLGTSLECQVNASNPQNVAYTITVDKSGKGNLTTIQSAIDSIPQGNTQWVLINVAPGKYREKIHIDGNRPCIVLQGAGSNLTIIQWGDHDMTYDSATFTSSADNFVAKDIKFKNTYNLKDIKQGEAGWRQAVSTRIKGDKSAFYRCSFIGVEDTFWDEKGRHYFNQCYFEGSVDFIFGKALSLFESCRIRVNIEKYTPGMRGYITAQKKDWADEESGFVFKNCVFEGRGEAYLGRAWGSFSTVIVVNSTLSSVIVPAGWFAWNNIGHEENFTYAEFNNNGPGADTSMRVPWEKKLNSSQLGQLLDAMNVDKDGWLQKLPNLSTLPFKTKTTLKLNSREKVQNGKLSSNPAGTGGSLGP